MLFLFICVYSLLPNCILVMYKLPSRTKNVPCKPNFFKLGRFFHSIANCSFAFIHSFPTVYWLCINFLAEQKMFLVSQIFSNWVVFFIALQTVKNWISKSFKTIYIFLVWKLKIEDFFLHSMTFCYAFNAFAINYGLPAVIFWNPLSPLILMKILFVTANSFYVQITLSKTKTNI